MIPKKPAPAEAAVAVFSDPIMRKTKSMEALLFAALS
jgi:hypothetical protein